MKNSNTTSWSDLKDQVYGEIGTTRRDMLDREFKSFKVGLQLREARETKKMTQDQLGEIIEKKRSFISRIENDASKFSPIKTKKKISFFLLRNFH